MLRVIVVMAFLVAAILPAVSGTLVVDDLSGQASVIDGDTLEIHGTRIRIFGIDAPESDQLCRDEQSDFYRCGQKTSNALFDYINRRMVECIEVDRDRYRRAVSVCSVGGIDIADWLVRNGLALDWPQYSKGGYADAQAEAKQGQRGNPCRYSRQGQHVDEERRAVLRPVAPQRPCVLIEADAAKTLKINL